MQLRSRLVFACIGLFTLTYFVAWKLFLPETTPRSRKLTIEVINFGEDHKETVDWRPKTTPKIGSKKIIIFWTNFFGSKPEPSFDDCPELESKCYITTNRSMVDSASAVVFHLIENDFDVNDVPKTRLPTQRYVFLTMESAKSYSHMVERRKMHSPENFFNWSMTYRRDSDIPFLYGGYGWMSPKENKKYGFTPFNMPYDEKGILENKTSSVYWLVSNCITPSKRENAVAALGKYIMIDVYGKCAKDTRKRDACPTSMECENDLGYMNYYHIAAENAVCKDYITEKYWNRYHFPSIPIVMRRSVYESRLPTHSFIAMDDFKSAKEMANYLVDLSANKTKYFEYFKWRTSGWVRIYQNEQFRNGYCKLCEALHQKLPNKVIPDAVKWLNHNSQCEGSEFADSWKND